MRASPLPSSRALNDSTATLARRMAAGIIGQTAPLPRLVVQGRPTMELRLERQDHPYRIGRGTGCDLVVADDDMSREHAAIERRWDGVFVRDRASKNGVRVQGEQLEGERRLADGDVVEMGRTIFILDDPSDRNLRQVEEGSPPASPVCQDLSATNTAVRGTAAAGLSPRDSQAMGRMRVRPTTLLIIAAVVLAGTFALALSFLLAR